MRSRSGKGSTWASRCVWWRAASGTGITHVADPLLTPAGPIAEKYGGEDASGDAAHYYAAPNPDTGYFEFNGSRPPFSDPDVRRAAALAIDRQALAEIWGNVPSDQLLPPVMPGVDQELYPQDGSRLDEARALLHGRTVRAVMGVGVGNDRGRREAEIVRSNLAPIGIDVEIEEIPGLGYDPPPADADVDLYGLGIGPFLYAGLATDEVPVAVTIYGAIPTLLSPSLGCRAFPPFGYGVDLAALCPSHE